MMTLRIHDTGGEAMARLIVSWLMIHSWAGWSGWDARRRLEFQTDNRRNVWLSPYSVFDRSLSLLSAKIFVQECKPSFWVLSTSNFVFCLRMMLSLTYHQLSLYPVRLSFDRDGSRLKLQKPSLWGWRERNPAIYNGMKLFCYQIMRVVSPVLAMIDGWLVISTDKYSQDTRTLRRPSPTQGGSEYPSWRMETRTLCQVVAWDNGLCLFFQLSEFNNTGGILKLFHFPLNRKRTPFLRKY